MRKAKQVPRPNMCTITIATPHSLDYRIVEFCVCYRSYFNNNSNNDNNDNNNNNNN